MPYLAGLSEEDKRTFIHLLNNKHGNVPIGEEILEQVMDSSVDNSDLVALAEVSEEENYLKKNRYRLQRTTIDFADKKRMPVDEKSVRDILRNQHIVRWKMRNELRTYQ